MSNKSKKLEEIKKLREIKMRKLSDQKLIKK
jgi:hypothetical protein